MKNAIGFVVLLLALSTVILAQCDYITVACGGRHVLGLREDGSVWAWGHNGWGQLGDGTYGDTISCNYCRTTPVQVVGPDSVGHLKDIIAIAAGNYFSLALKSDGTVWAWGSNSNGQLGDGTHGDTVWHTQTTPVQVVGPGGEGYLENVIAIAAGINNSLAITSDGSVWAWGNNYYGIGDGTNQSDVPSQVVGPDSVGYFEDAIDISVGERNCLVLKSDSTVWAWGQSYYGVLGNKTHSSAKDSQTPVQVRGPGPGYLTDIIDVSVAYLHAKALRADSTVWTWGLNDHGQLGNGYSGGGATYYTAGKDADTAMQVVGPACSGYLTDIVMISAGKDEHTVALRADGTVWTWGENNNGQLGVGNITDQKCPTQVLGPDSMGFLEDIVYVSAGEDFCCAIKEDGSVWCWGSNGSGQLGYGISGGSIPYPVQVDCPILIPTAYVATPADSSTSSCNNQSITWYIDAPFGVDPSSIEVFDGDSLYKYGDTELYYTSSTATSGELRFRSPTLWDSYDTVRVCLTMVADSTEPVPLTLRDSVCAFFYIDQVPPVLIDRDPDSGFVTDEYIGGITVQYHDSGCGADSTSWRMVIEGDTFDITNAGVSTQGDSIVFINFFLAGVNTNPNDTITVELTIWDTPDLCPPNETTYTWWLLYNDESIDEAELPENFGLSVWPNPFNGAVTISLPCHSRESGNLEGKVGIEIYDINGRMVYAPSPSVPLPRGEGGNSFSLWEKVAEGRMRAFIWQPDESISSGVYLIRVKYGNKTEIKKVMYLK